MAKVQGVFTGYKGKVGNTVYAMWKGVQTFKTKSNPSNPQTAGQTTNRSAFTSIIETFKALTKTLVVYFWNPFATSKQTGWANLVGVNQSIQAGGAFDADNLIISQGSLPDQAIDGAVYAGTDVTITWTENVEAGASDGDFMFGAVFDEDSSSWYFNVSAVLRLAETLVVSCVAGLTAADLKSFLVCYNGTLGTLTVTDVSDSSFLQVTT